jgi:hypothetical protein
MAVLTMERGTHFRYFHTQDSNRVSIKCRPDALPVTTRSPNFDIPNKVSRAN